jgi:hypothetical protein
MQSNCESEFDFFLLGRCCRQTYTHRQKQHNQYLKRKVCGDDDENFHIHATIRLCIFFFSTLKKVIDFQR